MIEMFTQIFIISALVIFGMALLVCLVRLIKGPTTADRVVSFDALECCCYVYCWCDERYF